MPIKSRNIESEKPISATDSTQENDDFLHYLSNTDEMRENVRSLVKISDAFSVQDMFPCNPKIYDFVDVIAGWEATVPSPIYAWNASSTLPKKRRSKTIVDLNCRRDSRSGEVPFSATLRSDMLEKDTYRYISGNGRYRLAKKRIRPAANQLRVETNYTCMPARRPGLCTDQRQLLCEMNRDLADEVNEADVTAENTDEELTSRDTTDVFKNCQAPWQPNTGLKDFQHTNFRKLEKKQVSCNYPDKAFTDRIMKNFSSKIAAIEDQYRGDTTWWTMAAGGVSNAKDRVDRRESRAHSMPLDSIRVLPMYRQNNSVTKDLASKLHEPAPDKAPTLKMYSATNLTNSPRYDYLESCIYNPFNLEVGRPKQVKSDPYQFKTCKTLRKPKNSVARAADKFESDDSSIGFQSGAAGKSYPCYKGVQVANETDLFVSPRGGLPELFGKKIGVTIAAHKW